MNVWRINLKTGGETPRKFCLENGIVAVGWPVDDNGGPLTWERYYDLAMEHYYNQGDRSWWPAVNALKNRMQIDDLVWTRDIQGVYYLGRITSDWRYEYESHFKKADMVNVRTCNWIKVGTVEAIPGKVVDSFIPARTVQKVADEQVKIYSMFLFNKLTSTDTYEIKELENPDIFSLLSSDDCEDILGLYLQKEKGYLLVPSSCKSDTMNYEYELRQKDTGEKAVAQVKNGWVDLHTDDYSNINSTVFLLTTKGQYLGDKQDNIHFVNPMDMEEFVFANIDILPDKIRNWTEILNELKNRKRQVPNKG
ncbi:MAG: hypothetical protein KatS3mg028_0902 [Bacteroidia bacterium]|nr:MAG: hypothetical protein KatS3mg028_0902 [Bacteroidia bacterium]